VLCSKIRLLVAEKLPRRLECFGTANLVEAMDL